MNTKTLVLKAIKIATNGNQRQFSLLLGISPPYTAKMLKTGHVAAAQCKKIEALTGGKITAEMLRPDIFAAPKPKKPRAAA